MVVLLGGMGRANVYAEALRAEGLPCVVAGGSIFNRAPEVALMVRLAQAVANPKWTSALFEVLSSELFALSADDLLELSTGMDEERGDSPQARLRPGLSPYRAQGCIGARGLAGACGVRELDASRLRAGGERGACRHHAGHRGRFRVACAP